MKIGNYISNTFFMEGVRDGKANKAADGHRPTQRPGAHLASPRYIISLANEIINIMDEMN